MACNALVAVAAFLKDVFMAGYVGTSSIADAFHLAYFIVDTISGNWLAFSVGTAAVTIFAKSIGSGSQILGRIWRNAMLLSVGLAFVAAIVLVGAVQFWDGTLFGFGAAVNMQFRTLLYIFTPLMFLLTFAALCTAMLQAHHRFLASAAAPLLMHSAFLVGALILTWRQVSPEVGIKLLAWSVIIGALAYVLVVGAALRSVSGTLSSKNLVEKLNRPSGAMQEMSVMVAAYSFLAIGMQAVYFWERTLAAQADAGTITALSYAFRISQVPVWVVATAAAAILLPRLSTAIGGQQWQEAGRLLGMVITFLTYVMLPLSAILFAWREIIVTVLFQRGAFDAGSVTVTAALLGGYALAIPWQSLSLFLIRYGIASGNVLRTALWIGVSTIVTMGIQWFLFRAWGPIGIGYGAAAGAALQSLLLLFPLYPLLKELRTGPGRNELAPFLIAAGLFIGMLFVGVRVWEHFPFTDAEFPRFAFAAIGAFISLAVYVWVMRKSLFNTVQALFTTK